MSATLELKDSSDKTFYKVLKYVKKAEYRLTVDSANFIGVARESGHGYISPEQVMKELYDASEGRIVGANMSLHKKNGRKIPLARVAAAFSQCDSAEKGLATQHPILKFEEPKQKNK